MPQLRSSDTIFDRNPRRDWCAEAIARLDPGHCGLADSALLTLDCPELGPGLSIYLKDETAHASGSLKHRLAHALFLHAICNGDIGPDTPVVEASSGSSAISEAWFARRLGLPFIAVVPASTAPAKIAAIRWSGGEIVKAEAGEDICALAEAVSAERGGHFMNQFARAAEVVDWRSENSLARALVEQTRALDGRFPSWIVAGAGTGGTSAGIGRYLRYRGDLAATQLCVVDPEGSAFFKAYSSGERHAQGRTSPVVEGIGRARVEPSFVPALIDQMLSIPDVASVAGAHWLSGRCGRRFGPSTGTNIVGALLLALRMKREGQEGAIVTLACDGGDRYAETVYAPDWLAAKGLDTASWQDIVGALAPFVP